MALETKLFETCKSLNVNCSLTYQKINDFSIEIYQGYKNAKTLFFTDGHIKKSVAIKKALEFLNKQQNT